MSGLVQMVEACQCVFVSECVGLAPEYGFYILRVQTRSPPTPRLYRLSPCKLQHLRRSRLAMGTRLLLASAKKLSRQSRAGKHSRAFLLVGRCMGFSRVWGVVGKERERKRERVRGTEIGGEKEKDYIARGLRTTMEQNLVQWRTWNRYERT